MSFRKDMKKSRMGLKDKTVLHKTTSFNGFNVFIFENETKAFKGAQV
jgi:hypothetical protein